MTRLQESANGPSLEVMKRRLDKDGLLIEDLLAENTALRAELRLKEDRQENDEPTILERVARVLMLAALAADPRQAARSDGDRVMRTDWSSDQTPGASTEPARRAVRDLHRGLLYAVSKFNQAAEHHWYPPRPPKEPQVRCCTRGCEAKDRRIPKYVGERGRGTMIELSYCQKCGNRLVAA